MEQFAIFLESFIFDIKIKKSKDNANDDAMSWLTSEKKANGDNISSMETDLVDEESTIVNKLNCNRWITSKELGEANVNDEETKILRECLLTGQSCDRRDRFNIEQTEFSLNQGCLLRGIRAYIPLKPRQRILVELHAGHFGITKMKTLARAYCWWPTLDDDVKNLSLNCTECQRIKQN
ncbi:uncharacterized protein LOC142239800 [Haematobia irritans]|uniref:uncharacterized protein LOC142239800 n=1 Tax=Haematobia irritans TaxID=7368 RepID=UPI003F4FB84D